jgi:hypothetical protein
MLCVEGEGRTVTHAWNQKKLVGNESCIIGTLLGELFMLIIW